MVLIYGFSGVLLAELEIQMAITELVRTIAILMAQHTTLFD
jgi:hypothetical protein